jgi:two-component system, NtrC family, response regulator AtoC
MTRSVLLIEDEPTLGKNIRTYLVHYDYDVRIATSAEAGLAELETFNPDIIILDFNLPPGMNGMDALAKIRALNRRTKVIMFTAHGSIDLAVKAMRAGAYNFITKPVVLSKLRAMLEKAINDEPRDQALS